MDSSNKMGLIQKFAESYLKTSCLIWSLNDDDHSEYVTAVIENLQPEWDQVYGSGLEDLDLVGNFLELWDDTEQYLKGQGYKKYDLTDGVSYIIPAMSKIDSLSEFENSELYSNMVAFAQSYGLNNMGLVE